MAAKAATTSTKAVDPVAAALSAKTVAVATEAVGSLKFSYYMPKHFWPLVALGATVILFVVVWGWRWSTESAIESAHQAGFKSGTEEQKKIEEANTAAARHKATQEELQEALRKLNAAAAGGVRPTVLKEVEVPAKKP